MQSEHFESTTENGHSEERVPVVGEAITVGPASGAQTGDFISKVSQVCREATKGNLEARLSVTGLPAEQAQCANLINRLLDVTDCFVREAGAALEHASQEKFYRTVMLRGLLGSFRNGAVLINRASEDMAGKSKQIADATVKRLQMADSFEKAVKGVVEMLANSAGEMSGTAGALAKLADNTSDRATAVAAASEESSMNVKTVAAATEELSSAVSEIGRQVGDSTQIAKTASNDAERTQSTVAGLSEASNKIGNVVKLISQIASQTNLLALNATIEAARAGEAGKGFAVVASEVKELARQTGLATEDIAKEVQGIQSVSTQAVTDILKIAETIKRMNEIASAIANSVNEQRIATREISDNVQQAAQATEEVSKNISGVTVSSQETSQAVTTVLEAANALKQQASTLSQAVDGFLVEIRA
jgi:methyl-accepting chemotaxis protein